MLQGFFKLKLWQQYAVSVATILVVSSVCFVVSDIIGYKSVALILLFSVSFLSIVLSVFPVLLSAILSALIWDFFFIPPYYTFHIDNTEDLLMLCMYFVIALLNGVLTSQIRFYEKQARLKEDKLNALKLYNTLFNSISHELRTPITTIMGVTENLISNRSNLSEKDKISLNNEVYIASERLNRLIDNLLNMSRLESGFLKPRIDWCDLHELIHTPLNRLNTELKNHTLNVNIAANAPFVKLDFGLMEQALYNIIHNASVHTKPKTTISIDVSVVNGLLDIKIRDNGQGFPQNQLKADLHASYNQPKRSTGGLGLGLSIVCGFVNAHKGSISISNNPEGGALVHIQIPVETTNMEVEYE